MKNKSERKQAQEARDRAISQVEKNRSEWLDLWKTSIHKVARKQEPFTSDNVLQFKTELEACPENRVAGAAFRALSAAGIIKPTGRYIESNRKKSHARPKREWILA